MIKYERKHAMNQYVMYIIKAYMLIDNMIAFL